MIESAIVGAEKSVRIIGIKELPKTLPELSTIYAKKIIEVMETNYTPNKQEELANAYFDLATRLMAMQVDTSGGFDPKADFSSLDEVIVFPGCGPGVEVCTACKGVGGLIKFERAPKDVECLKCRHHKVYPEKGKVLNIEITGDNIYVDGVKEEEPMKSKYYKLIGTRLEECKSCKGTGRYKKYPKKDLIINVECRNCNGKKINPENEKTQVRAKCRTCLGTRKVSIQGIIGKIKNTTKCKTCNGNAFVKPKWHPKLDNPVLKPKIAKKITVSDPAKPKE